MFTNSLFHTPGRRKGHNYLLILSAVCLLTACSTTAPKSTQNHNDLYDGQDKLAYQDLDSRVSPDHYNLQAETALQNGEKDRAIYYYIQSLNLKNEQPDILTSIGTIQMQNGKYPIAARAFSRALHYAPEKIDNHIGLGLSLLEMKKIDSAKSHLSAALTLDQARQRLTEEKTKDSASGDSAQSSNKDSVDGKKTLAVDKDSPYELYNGLGFIADLEQQFSLAQVYYRLAIKIDSDNPKLYNNLGYSYYLEEDLSNAESFFRLALELDPAYQQAWRNLALIHVRQNDYQDALDIFSRLMPEPEAYNTVGYLVMLTKQYEQAELFLEKAIELSPTYYKLARENLRQTRLLLEKQSK